MGIVVFFSTAVDRCFKEIGVTESGKEMRTCFSGRWWVGRGVGRRLW